MFRKIKPFGVVPVIDDGGFMLRESNTIVRYLASKHGRADLYPKDLKDPRYGRVWMDWTSTDFSSAMRRCSSACWSKPGYIDKVEAGAKEWSRQMRLLERISPTNGPYVRGRSFTVGDIPVGLVVNRWFSIPFEKPELRPCRPTTSGWRTSRLPGARPQRHTLS